MARPRRAVWRWRRNALHGASVVVLLLAFPGFLDFLRDPYPGLLTRNLEIVAVETGGAAEEAGLRPGDRIVAVEGSLIRLQSELRGALHALRGATGYRILVERDGTRFDVVLRAAVPPADRIRARLVNFLVALVFLAVGTVVLLRRQDTVGRLFHVNAWLLATVLFERPVLLDPRWRWCGDLASDAVQLVLPATLLHFFLRFPEGGFLARRTHLLYFPALLLTLVSGWMLFAIERGGVPASALSLLQTASGIYFGVYLLLGLGRFVAAVRRTRHPAQRQRLAIVRNGALLGLGPLALVVVAKQIWPAQDLPGSESIGLSLVLVPTSFGYAIAKHGALEFRAVLRGGLLYLALTVVLVLFYFLVVDGAGGALARSFDLPPLVVSLCSILAIAFTIVPLRRSLERAVDQALYPEQRRLAPVLQDFAREVTAALRPDEIWNVLRRRVHSLYGVQSLEIFLVEAGANGRGLRGVSGSVEFPLHSTLGRYVLRHGRAVMAEYLRGSSLERQLDEPSRRFLAEQACAVVLPVGIGGRVHAVACAGSKSNGLYTSAEESVLRHLCQQAVLAFENMALQRARIEKLRLEQELVVAHQVQAGLIPTRCPRVDGLEVVGRILASEEVGGDYYDFMPLGDGQLGVAVGDVAGHGVPAAILMASMQMSLRSEARTQRTPAEVIRNLNAQVTDWLSPGRFVSLFYCVYDSADALLTFCNAGLDPPLLFRAGGSVQRLSRGGTVLGIGREHGYLDGILKLHPEDVLLIHTDGIVEQQNARGEQFGESRLVDLVQRHVSEPLEEIRERVLGAVVDFGARSARDDMTVVLLRCS